MVGPKRRKKISPASRECCLSNSVIVGLQVVRVSQNSIDIKMLFAFVECSINLLFIQAQGCRYKTFDKNTVHHNWLNS